MLTVDFDRLAIGPGTRVLDIGCGMGRHSFEAFRRGASVTAADLDRKVLAEVDKMSEAMVEAGEAPTGSKLTTKVVNVLDMPFATGSFDVIIASDVLEHLADAPRALAAWYQLLRPGGTLVVFVPAFKFLWSEHDRVNHHFHRYRATELAGLLQYAGFEIHRQGYWNFFLFFPVAFVRLAKRFFARPADKLPSGDLKAVPRLLNSPLILLLRIENWLMHLGLNFPWGVSASVIAQKRTTA